MTKAADLFVKRAWNSKHDKIMRRFKKHPATQARFYKNKHARVGVKRTRSYQ